MMKKTNLFIFSLFATLALSIFLAVPAPADAATLKKTTVTVNVDWKSIVPATTRATSTWDLIAPQITIVVRHGGVTGHPSELSYTLINPTLSKDEKYIIYSREIDRTGSNMVAVDDKWDIRASYLPGAYYRFKNSAVISGDPFFIANNTTGITYIPRGVVPPVPNPDSNPNPSPTPAPASNTPAVVSQGGPLSVLMPFIDINKVGPTTSICPEDSDVYTKGILAGVPCNRGAIDSLEEVLQVVENVVSGLILPTLGVIFIIVILVGGILYITSAGNPKRIELAKKTLTAAIIGLLIVILSYTIIQIFAGVLGGSAE